MSQNVGNTKLQSIPGHFAWKEHQEDAYLSARQEYAERQAGIPEYDRISKFEAAPEATDKDVAEMRKEVERALEQVAEEEASETVNVLARIVADQKHQALDTEARFTGKLAVATEEYGTTKRTLEHHEGLLQTILANQVEGHTAQHAKDQCMLAALKKELASTEARLCTFLTRALAPCKSKTS